MVADQHDGYASVVLDKEACMVLVLSPSPIH